MLKEKHLTLEGIVKILNLWILYEENKKIILKYGNLT